MNQDAPTSPPETTEWRLRACRPGDARRVQEGFERVNGWAIGEETWRWKLLARPTKVDNAWIAVDRDERPIFHYAGIPCRLRLPTGTLEILVAVDLWTVPEYRRRGVFTRCAQWVHDHWRRAGVAGLYGAPNEQFGTRDHFLGWRHLFPLRWLIRPLRPEAIVARRLGWSALGRLSAVGAAWNQVWDRRSTLAPEIEIRQVGLDDLDGSPWPEAKEWGLERGESWVRWRYLTCPRYPYQVLTARRDGRIVGYLVYRLEEQEGRRFAYVAELVIEDQDPVVTETLISVAITRLSAAGAVAIATLAAPSTELYRVWRRRGFLFSWGSFGVQCLPFSSSMDPTVMRDPNQWTLAGGDLDVI